MRNVLKMIEHNKVLLSTCDKMVEEIIVNRLADHEIDLMCYEDSSSSLVSVLDYDFQYAIIDDELKGFRGNKMVSLIHKIRPKLPIIYIYNDSDNIKSEIQNIKLSVHKPITVTKMSEILKKILA